MFKGLCGRTAQFYPHKNNLIKSEAMVAPRHDVFIAPGEDITVDGRLRFASCLLPRVSAV